MPARPLLLVVDDGGVQRDLFRVALGVSNFAVHACEDGLDALHYLDQARPDVIVLDLDIPGVSGTVLYEEMRGRRQADRVPIVVLTGRPSVPELPGATILRKPITPDDLIKAVEAVLVQRERTWLFSRGRQSVLVSRITESGSHDRLLVYGPGQAVALHECRNPVECAARQHEIERALIAEGYQLLATERRSGQERRTRPRDDRDRRRALSDVEEQSDVM